MAKYETNLASEFFVLSTLYRLGLDANLTLGNKKSVDITVVLGPSDVITIDVKAVAKCMDWPISNRRVAHPDRHFVVLLCYNDAFGDPAVAPDSWVVPFGDLATGDLTKDFRGDMRCIVRRRLLQQGERYREAWSLLRPTGQPG